MSSDGFMILLIRVFLIFCLQPGCIQSKNTSRLPTCKINNVTSCSVSEYPENSKALQRKLKNLSVRSRIPSISLQSHKDLTRIERNGNTTNTTVVLQFYGNAIEIRKLKAIFIEVIIYQGPGEPPATKHLLLKIQRAPRLSNVDILFTFHVSNVIIPIQGSSIMGKITFMWLPCFSKMTNVNNLKKCTIEVNNVSVSKGTKIEHSKTKGNEDKCVHPKMTFTNHTSKSVTVSVCSGTAQIIYVRLKGINGTTLKHIRNSIGGCQFMLNNLEAGTYTVDCTYVFDCDKDNYKISEMLTIGLPQQPTYRISQMLSKEHPQQTKKMLTIGLPQQPTFRKTQMLSKEHPQQTKVAQVTSDNLSLIYIVIASFSSVVFLAFIALLLYRQFRCSVKTTMSLFVPSLKKKLKEIAQDRSMRTGTMVIALENNYYTKHILMFLHNKNVLVRNIQDPNEGMKNWMDWVEQSARQSQNYLFVVTDDLYELYRQRKDRIGKDCHETSALLGTEPCLYAFTLVRQRIAKQSSIPMKYRQRVHLLCLDKGISKRFRKLHTMFQGPETYTYDIPNYLFGADFSKNNSMKKMIKRLKTSEDSGNDTSIEVEFTLPIDNPLEKLQSPQKDDNETASSETISSTLLPSSSQSSEIDSVVHSSEFDSVNNNDEVFQQIERKSGKSYYSVEAPSRSANIIYDISQNESLDQVQNQQELYYNQPYPTGTYSSVDGSVNPDRPIRQSWYCREHSGSLRQDFPYPFMLNHNVTYVSSTCSAFASSRYNQPPSKCSAVHGSSAPSIHTDTQDSSEEFKVKLADICAGSCVSSCQEPPSYPRLQPDNSMRNHYGLLSDETSGKQVHCSNDSGFETKMEHCLEIDDKAVGDDESQE